MATLTFSYHYQNNMPCIIIMTPRIEWIPMQSTILQFLPGRKWMTLQFNISDYMQQNCCPSCCNCKWPQWHDSIPPSIEIMLFKFIMHACTLFCMQMLVEVGNNILELSQQHRLNSLEVLYSTVVSYWHLHR